MKLDIRVSWHFWPTELAAWGGQAQAFNMQRVWYCALCTLCGFPAFEGFEIWKSFNIRQQFRDAAASREKCQGLGPLGQVVCVTLSVWLQGACKWTPLGTQKELEMVFWLNCTYVIDCVLVVSAVELIQTLLRSVCFPEELKTLQLCWTQVFAFL